MTLTELIDPHLVVLKADCSSKDELISKLAEKISAKVNELPISPEEILKKIHTREEIGGTLLPSGLSIPHARLLDYEDFILVLGTAKEPIFHDGLQVRLMALMISSQSGGANYLPTLASLAKLSRDEEFFSRLCGIDNTEDFINALKERDTELV